MAASVASLGPATSCQQQRPRSGAFNPLSQPAARCVAARARVVRSGAATRWSLEAFADASTPSKHTVGLAEQERADAVPRCDDSEPSSSSDSVQPMTALMLAGLLGVFVLASGSDPAAAATDAGASHTHLTPALGDLAAGGEEDFVGNVAAYGRYFVSVMLGTAYIMTKPFAEALKRPKTAVLVVLGTGALFWFLSASVRLMLGLDDGGFEYTSRGI